MNTLVVTLVVMVVCIAKATVQGACDNPGKLTLKAKMGKHTSMSQDSIFTADDADTKARAIFKPGAGSSSFTLSSITVDASNAKKIKVVGVKAADGERVIAKVKNFDGPITMADLTDLGSDLTFKKLIIVAKPTKGATASFVVGEITGC